jgi:hypothetical protein
MTPEQLRAKKLKKGKQVDGAEGGGDEGGEQ